MSASHPAELELAPGDAAALKVRRGEDLIIRGRGVARGLDLTGLNFKHLRLRDELPVFWNLLAPRPLKIDRGRTLTFEDCDFSGLRAGWFEPGDCRFIRCRFHEVQAKSGLVQAQFVDCTFGGNWDANLSAKPSSHDPAGVVTISGNDFSRLTGVNFYGGVPRQANHFATSDTQLILQRGGPGWEVAQELAHDESDLQIIVSSLLGEGPLGYDQDWQLLERRDFSEDVWQALVAGAARQS